ncbi:MAG: type II toxin-antitoxin system RelE/ParE family toxin [Blastocatellia bacterium]
MSFRIVIEEQAYAEMEEGYRWQAQYSPEAAMLWYFDITERIESLENHPFRCPLAPENDLFPEEIRHLIFEKYRILFTVKDEAIHVLHVWHGRRDYAKPGHET